MSKRIKCSPEGFCDALDDRLNDDNSSRKGMSALILLNTNTGTSRTAGVVWKKDSKDRGLLFNFCPWCGTGIDWISKEAKTP